MITSKISFNGKTHKNLKNVFNLRIKNAREKCNTEGLRLNQLNEDVFQSPINNVSGINNVRAGEYSAVCDGSKPMPFFINIFGNIKQSFENLIRKGMSTNIKGIAPSYLKSRSNRPLSTSKVHDCSVAYIHNERTKTHFLFHIPPNMDEKSIQRAIEIFMPEGFQHAAIVPGYAVWTGIHRENLPKIFSAIKKVNPKSSVEVFHTSSELPEIVGYKGKMFEIMNTKPYKSHWNEGQATFRISDIRNDNTLTKVGKSRSIRYLIKLKKSFNQTNYDNEVKKVLDKYIDQKIEKLKHGKK